MAAVAPITAKKGAYSGLSSEDILALFSRAMQLQGRLLVSNLGFPRLTTGQVTTLRERGEKVAANKITGVEEENGETEKVT